MSSTSMSCAGKVVLVTGAQRGIGRAVALRFAQAGADVALNFLDDETAVKSAAAEIAALGRRAVMLGADIAKPEHARRLVADAEHALGPLDVLVNNAAIFPRAPFLELTEDTWDAVLDTNLTATFVCAQEAARRMVAAGRRGAIINRSSGAPYRGSMRATAYMASKLGIVGLTRGMARELAPHGIRVNAVAPGITNTAMPRLGNSEEALAALGRANPTGRLAEPDDIAEVVVFLATDAARYAVGQIIHVNGGDYHG
jgi:NAD(P)-dependent dehydrogenase (short-subunit alcohol dehydrogenase family)